MKTISKVKTIQVLVSTFTLIGCGSFEGRDGMFSDGQRDDPGVEVGLTENELSEDRSSEKTGASSKDHMEQDLEMDEQSNCKSQKPISLNFERNEELDDVADINGKSNFVTFENLGHTRMAIAKVAYAHDDRPIFTAWKSVKCPKKPNANQACFSDGLGHRALSADNAMTADQIEFAIEFDTPIWLARFDIIDLDGGESWDVTGLDGNGSPVVRKAIDARSGYAKKSGNSEVTSIEINTEFEVSRLEFRGKKRSSKFGFAFDNFYFKKSCD